VPPDMPKRPTSTSRWYASLRHRLKSSSIRRIYWAVAKRKLLISGRREEDFYRNLLVGLNRDDLIFDIGANQGAKTDIFLKLGARVVAVEPDDACQAILRDRFLRYRLNPRPVTLVGKAVSDKLGIENMWIDGPGSAVNTFSRKWADTLKENKQSFKHGHCGLDFSRTKPVEATTVDELISLQSFEINLRAFRNEGIECVRVLSRLEPSGRFNYTPDCCAGFVLKEWLKSEEFGAALDSCTDESIEVFWRTD
jgi:FkbM family methyltransferase